MAKLISERAGVEINYLPNPRKKDDENELHVNNDRFAHKVMAYHPERRLPEEITEIARQHAEQCGMRFDMAEGRSGGRKESARRLSSTSIETRRENRTG